MKIVFSEKQTVHKQGDFKPKAGMKFRGMSLWAVLQSENDEVV